MTWQKFKHRRSNTSPKKVWMHVAVEKKVPQQQILTELRKLLSEERKTRTKCQLCYQVTGLSVMSTGVAD